MGSQYDSVIPVWMQLLMHKKIQHSEFVIIRNTAHIAKLEQKDAFNRILRNFLKKHSKVS
jgi:3-oxoadipate enol-lactonase